MDTSIPEKTVDYLRELVQAMEAVPGGVALTRQYGAWFAETDGGMTERGAPDPLGAVRQVAREAPARGGE